MSTAARIVSAFSILQLTTPLTVLGDEVVYYDCHNLNHFDEALDAVRKNSGFTEEQLCHDYLVPRKVKPNCGAENYAKNAPLFHDSIITKNYDIDSIMHFSSEMFSNPKKYDRKDPDPKYAPLLRRVPDGSDYLEIIPDPKTYPDITYLDWRCITQLYP